MESLPIVPFGKYKNQPITSLLTDNSYLEWLKNQEFFKQKHITLYNIIVNQQLSVSNEKTPEHNKMQNFFLIKNNCANILNAMLKSYYNKHIVQLNNIKIFLL